MKTLARYFGSGLLFLIPVVVTIYAVYWLFTTVDNTVLSILMGEQAESEPGWWRTGLGVAISLGVITLVGFLTSLFITRPIMQVVEKVFGRLPLIKLLYSSIKDLIGAFVGEKKKFDKPVLVSLTESGNVKLLGFVTRTSLECLGLTDQVAVYLPQSYNFAGSVVIVPGSQVAPLAADSSEVMTFIVSGGVSGVGAHSKVGVGAQSKDGGGAESRDG